jgi:predicted transcriptional regulator
VKTLAIRLEDDLHAQLTMVAQLGELTITDAIRQAIDQWIETKRSQPELAARAQSVLDEIENDAAQRRSAIATLFGGSSDSSPAAENQPEGETPQRRSRGKGGESATS